MIAYAITLLVLFLNFYIKAYLIRSDTKKKTEVKGEILVNGKSKHE